jgi:hypothetical protein
MIQVSIIIISPLQGLIKISFNQSQGYTLG